MMCDPKRSWPGLKAWQLFRSRQWRAQARPLSWRTSVETSAPLILVIAVALAVRCHTIGGAILTYDESSSWRITQYPTHELIHRTIRDAHPPLFYLTLKVWQTLWGSTPIALRSMS